MKHSMPWVVGIGVGLMVALVGILSVATPPGPSVPVASCPYSPNERQLDYVSPGQPQQLAYLSIQGPGVYGRPPVPSRLSIWSNSTAIYSLYLLTESQYDSYQGNGTGFNGSIHTSPPSSYYWRAVDVSASNDTLILGTGAWALLVYDPNSVAITISLEVDSCSGS